MQNTQSKGSKGDLGKPAIWRLPKGAFGLIADCLRGYAHGARKYGESNWQKVAPRRYRAALFRHIDLGYLDGEITDSETGLPHLALALCNIFILHWFDAHPDLAKKLDEEDAAREESERAKNTVAERRSNLDPALIRTDI